MTTAPASIARIIATRAAKQPKAQEALTALNTLFIKDPTRFSGKNRKYDAFDANDKDIPNTDDQPLAGRVWAEMKPAIQQLADVASWSLTLARANTEAKGKLEIGGISIAGIPVTYLLELEKKLQDLLTLVRNAPTQDPRVPWSYHKDQDCFVAKGNVTVRTRKTPTVIVKAPATENHPAQAELINMDQPVGQYTDDLSSGALPLAVKRDTMTRLTAAIEAVKAARAEANSQKVSVVENDLPKLFDWLTQPITSISK